MRNLSDVYFHGGPLDADVTQMNFPPYHWSFKYKDLGEYCYVGEIWYEDLHVMRWTSFE